MKSHYNHTQQQLLKVLGIVPLQLADAFQNQHADSTESTNFIAPDVSQPLAADIVLAIAGRRQWLIDSTLSQPVLNDHQLITPALTQLTTAAQKRALWQLFSKFTEGDAVTVPTSE